MKIIKSGFNHTEDIVVVLGNFDGIHRGHQALIKRAIEISAGHDLKSAIFTFNRHPSYVIARKDPVPLILTKYEKQRVLEKTGLDFYIEYPFTVEFANRSPEDFIKRVLVDELHVKYIVVGDDYRFGHRGSGDVHLLQELGERYGFKVDVLEKIMVDGREISSSWIRKELMVGNVEKANFLLGREYIYIGDVVRGEQIGRTIGYPTANVVPSSNKILPRLGVYQTKVEINGEFYDGMTNIGSKPTVSGKNVTVETYILDFDRMIYKEEITLYLERFLRPETKFNNLKELKEQIKKDIDRIYKNNLK